MLLTMLRASVITCLGGTVAAMPALVTHTVSPLTVAMVTAVQVTQLSGTALPYPAMLTLTCASLHVPGAVTGAVRLASPLLSVHLVTSLSSPSLATHTGPSNTVAMASTPRVNTVN